MSLNLQVNLGDLYVCSMETTKKTDTCIYNSIYVVTLYVYDFVNANYIYIYYIFCVYMCDEYV